MHLGIGLHFIYRPIILLGPGLQKNIFSNNIGPMTDRPIIG